MDELERNDALPEHELAAIIEEVNESQDQLEEAAHSDQNQAIKSTSKGAGGWAWSVAVMVMLFGLFMLIPAGLNTALGAYALLGLSHEAMGDYESAIAIYSMDMGQEIEAWAVDNFSFGNSEAPGFTTNNFGIARSLGIISKQASPLDFVRNQQFMSLFGQLNRVPRSMKDFAAQVELIDGLFAAVEELAWELGTQPTIEQELQLLETMRVQDRNATRHKLIYDAVALFWVAMDDLASEEVTERLEALMSEPGSEAWMYEAVSGALETNLPLMQIEQLYSAGKFDEAIARSDELIAATENQEQYLIATAMKGVALMLRGNIEQAFELLSETLEENISQPNAFLFYAALAAAIAAEEFGFVDFLVPPNMRESMPPDLLAFMAGETTLESIFLPGQAEQLEEETEAEEEEAQA